MAYRVGLPFWKMAAKLGVRLKIRVVVFHDEEADVFGAYSPDLKGLHCEAKTVPELREIVDDCIMMLLSHELGQGTPRFRQQTLFDFSMA